MTAEELMHKLDLLIIAAACAANDSARGRPVKSGEWAAREKQLYHEIRREIEMMAELLEAARKGVNLR